MSPSKFSRLAARVRPRFIASALFCIAFLANGVALAQRAPSLFHFSPRPLHMGTDAFCDISCRRAELMQQYKPRACLEGTFVSADLQVLAQQDIRLKPDAEFWPHNGWRPETRDIAFGRPHNPWRIDPSAIDKVVVGLPVRLAEDIRLRVGQTSDFQLYYTGEDLIRDYGFKACDEGDESPSS